jgi:alpha-1,6-mannosyltransferase
VLDSRRHASRRLPAAFAVVGFVALAIVAATPGSPLQPVLPPGAQPSGPFRWLGGALGVDHVHGAALAALSIGAVCVATASFLVALRAAWRRELSVRLVVGLAVAFHVAVLFLPLLVSRDVYSYVMYGRIAGVYDANPYVSTPADFRADAAFGFIGPRWHDTPAVYGPGFTTASALLARALRSLPSLIVAYRAIAAVASIATVAIVAALAGRAWSERAAFAAAVIGINPVVVFQSVGSGHNDTLVMLAVAAGIALVVARRDVSATCVLALGTLVKVTAALPLVLLLVVVVARSAPGQRLRTFAAHTFLAGAVVLPFAIPYLQAKDPSLGVLELAGHEGWLAPSRLVRRLADGIGTLAGSEVVGSVLGLAVRIAFTLALLVAIVAIARDAARRAAARDLGAAGIGATWGWGLLALMLLGPVLLPWYVTWALPLSWLLPRVPRTVLIGVSTALAVSQWAAEPARFPTAYDVNVLAGHYVIAPIVAGLLLWLLADLRRRLRGAAPLEDQPQGVPAAAG